MRHLRELLSDYDSEPVGLLVSLHTLVLGLWWLAPWWDTFPASPSLRLLDDFMPEASWGALVAALGLVGLASVVGNWAERWTMLVLCGLWSFLAVIFWIGSSGSTSFAAHALLIALASAWVHLRTFWCSS